MEGSRLTPRAAAQMQLSTSPRSTGGSGSRSTLPVRLPRRRRRWRLLRSVADICGDLPKEFQVNETDRQTHTRWVFLVGTPGCGWGLSGLSGSLGLGGMGGTLYLSPKCSKICVLQYSRKWFSQSPPGCLVLNPPTQCLKDPWHTHIILHTRGVFFTDYPRSRLGYILTKIV